MLKWNWLCLWLNKRATCPRCFIHPTCCCLVVGHKISWRLLYTKCLLTWCPLPVQSAPVAHVCSQSTTSWLCAFDGYIHPGSVYYSSWAKNKIWWLPGSIHLPPIPPSTNPLQGALFSRQPQSTVQINHEISHGGSSNAEDSNITEDSR